MTVEIYNIGALVVHATPEHEELVIYDQRKGQLDTYIEGREQLLKFRKVIDYCLSKAPEDDRYPEGFDESCGIDVKYVQEANRVLADLIQHRQWDVLHVAAAIQAAAEGKL